LECCARSRTLEHSGNYEAARDLLSEWWDRVGERPKLNALSEQEAAAVLLRVGCLTGWLGSARQVEGAQELSLDLLSECAEAFQRLGDAEGHAEAQLGMARAYWRKASYDEARVILSFMLDTPEAGEEQTLCAVVMKATVECSAGEYKAALRLHERTARLFEREEVPARLKAPFFYAWALTHRKLNNIDEALLKYAVAKKYLEQTGDTSRLAIVETALGFLFYTIKSFDQAVEHTEKAIALYASESNKRGVAEANETLSRVLAEVGDYEGAERASRSAVTTLRVGEEKALLVEALTSLGTALARQGKRREAYAAFGEAEHEALNFVGQAAAAAVERKVIEELVATGCRDAGLTLEEPVSLLEKSIVRGALQHSNKSMREAALRLGVEYDTLRYIVNNRHPELREVRTPVYTRPHRGAIKQDSSKVKSIRDRRGKS
jgi:tetratricopeptide (TPR) repeat protein